MTYGPYAAPRLWRSRSLRIKIASLGMTLPQNDCLILHWGGPTVPLKLICPEKAVPGKNARLPHDVPFAAKASGRTGGLYCATSVEGCGRDDVSPGVEAAVRSSRRSRGTITTSHARPQTT